MISDADRRIVLSMLKLGRWKAFTHMRLPEIQVDQNSEIYFEKMLARQEVDNLHHAPCCPANHYHKRRLVFSRCICGATREMRR